MLAAANLSFRPLRLDDLPMIRAWMNVPHAVRWWGREDVSEYEDYIAGRTPIFPYVVSYGSTPIGLVEWVRFGDHPDFMRTYGVTDPFATNMDVLIGDPAFVHRGLGGPMIRRFLTEIVFADPRISTCLIDPEPENRIAIRAYEKVGFRWVRDLADDGEGHPVYLMELTRAELLGG